MAAETAQEFGEELKRERELREVSREQLAKATKVSLRQIEALETGRFELLPARVFTRGFVRSIALHLGLDAEKAAAAFCHVHETWRIQKAEHDSAEMTLPGLTRRLSQPRRSVSVNRAVVGLGLALALALAAGLAMLMTGGPRTERPRERATSVATASAVPTAPAPVTNAVLAVPSEVEPPPRLEPAIPPKSAAEKPVAAPAALPAATPAAIAEPRRSGAMVLTLTFRDDCWTELSVDGKFAAAEMFKKGMTREFSAASRFVLTLGNAGAVSATLNGRTLKSLGGEGKIVKNLILPDGSPSPSHGG